MTSTEYTNSLDRVLHRLEGVKRRSGGRFVALCPAHDDKNPSLSVSRGRNGRVLLKCHTGCSFESIRIALGLESHELFDHEPPAGTPSRNPTTQAEKRQIQAVYQYQDEQGAVLFEVVRFHPKDFRQRRRGPSGEYVWNLTGVRHVLYRLPDIKARSSEQVIVVEGEKDADRLFELGHLATTSPMGAGKWEVGYSEALRGRAVCIIPDNDKPGKKHALQVAFALNGIASGVRIVDLPGESKDISDWLDDGHAPQELGDLISNARLFDPAAKFDEDCANQPPLGSASSGHAIVISADEIPSKELEWIWPGWLPKGMLTIFGGYSGDGKSTIATELAAVLSNGGNFPDGSRAPLVNTLFLSAEEDPQYALKPRLDLFGANASRVFILKGIADERGDTRLFSLKKDLPGLRQAVIDHGIGLVVIDPLSTYLSNADRNNEGDVRDTLSLLSPLMEETGVAVLGIMHIGKTDAAGRRPEQLLLGSTAFVALARAIWMLNRVPEDDDSSEDNDSEQRKVLGVVKSSYAQRPRSLSFTRLKDGPIKWHGHSTIPIEETFVHGAKRSTLEKATSWLMSELAGGSKPATEITNGAKAAGFSESTIRRARERLNVESFKLPHVRNGQWLWRLPNGVPVIKDEGVDAVTTKPEAAQTQQSGGTLEYELARIPELDAIQAQWD